MQFKIKALIFLLKIEIKNWTVGRRFFIGKAAKY